MIFCFKVSPFNLLFFTPSASVPAFPRPPRVPLSTPPHFHLFSSPIHSHCGSTSTSSPFGLGNALTLAGCLEPRRPEQLLLLLYPLIESIYFLSQKNKYKLSPAGTISMSNRSISGRSYAHSSSGSRTLNNPTRGVSNPPHPPPPCITFTFPLGTIAAVSAQRLTSIFHIILSDVRSLHVNVFTVCNTRAMRAFFIGNDV